MQVLDKYDALFKELDAKIPWQKTPEELERRKVLWKQFDVNGNGFLSLAEVDKGFEDVIDLPCVLDT